MALITDNNFVSLCMGILPLYMGNFYIRCEVKTWWPSGDSWGNIHKIYSQTFSNLQEYAFEANDVIHRPQIVHTFGHFTCNEST